jgi:hypothetical protein
MSLLFSPIRADAKSSASPMMWLRVPKSGLMFFYFSEKFLRNTNICQIFLRHQTFRCILCACLILLLIVLVYSSGRSTLGTYALGDMVSIGADSMGVIVRVELESFRILDFKGNVVTVRLQVHWRFLVRLIPIQY